MEREWSEVWGFVYSVKVVSGIVVSICVVIANVKTRFATGWLQHEQMQNGEQSPTSQSVFAPGACAL